jgi:hypothetical protein
VQTEILTATQLAVLEGLTAVAAVWEFYLAGGTALAQRHGHRRSIDFEFFREAPFDVQEPGPPEGGRYRISLPPSAFHV